MSAVAALSAPELSDAEFRALVRQSALVPYERLMGASTAQAVGGAERVLSEGWRLGGAPALDLAGQLPWDDFAPTSRSWNFHLNCWDPLEELLAAYSVTSEQRYLQPAVRVALDWIEGHANVEAGGAHAWYDMAVGVRAYRLAYVLDAAVRAEWLSDAELSAMRASLEVHRTELGDDDKVAFHNNHGFYQVAGQLAMARRFGAFSQAMHDSLVQAKERMLRMLEQQFTSEGVHREHSPDYHRMVYDTLKGIMDAGLLADRAIEDRVNAIERSLAWFILPNGYLANFGDSDYRLCSRGTRAAMDKWRTPEMRFAVTGGQIGERSSDTLRAFETSGYLVVCRPAASRPSAHEQSSYLAQIAAFHSRTHKHADDLSFIWYDRGCQILVDAGRYGYDGKTEVGSELWQDGFWYSDPNRVYVESTRAHNTVEIDDRNYLRKGAKPYGSALKRSGLVGDDVYFSECETKQFKSVRHVRVLIFRPGNWLVVWDWLHDNLNAQHDYRQWFHFAPELSVRLHDEQYVVTSARWNEPLRVASLLPGTTCSKPVLGREGPAQQGWWSPKARVIVPNYALAFEQRARSVVFATALAFCSDLVVHPSSRVAPSGRSTHLRFGTNGSEHILNFSRPEEGDIELSYRLEST
jgi:hypothetical protein